MTPNEYYNRIIEESNLRLKKLKKQSLAIAMLRLAVFAATVAACFIAGSSALIAVCLLIGIVLFLLLAKVSNRLTILKSVEQAKIDRTDLNIDRLNLRFDRLPKGEEYIDPTHDFTFDIDVFGKHSLFSLLNATSTAVGSKKLAEWLISPLNVADDVQRRQAAIEELSHNNDFRLKMASIGQVVSDEMPVTKFETSQIPDFSINPLWRWATQLIPFIYIALFALMAFDIVSGTTIFLFFVGVLVAGSIQAKRVTRLHEWLTNAVKRIAGCSDIFRAIEEENFTSELLQALQGDVKSDHAAASVLSARLNRILNNLDQRYNAFGYAIMNGFLLWDLRQLNNVDRWMKANKGNISKWDNAIAQFDALCALAIFRFNNPGYCYPTVDPTGNIVIEAAAAGHPLIAADKCVCIDIAPLRLSAFFVITGANMAGKSTYLRTVATNYLLALIGAPVFARSMTFSPATLLTGLRTSDSLSDGASYFFAELLRLQQVVQRAEKGEKMLVILDEILRGTNSTDKQKGSLGLVRKLVNLPVAGIIATHDLALGTLADAFPRQIRNFRFEADTAGDRLLFSYRILPGIAQNANAYHLMTAMGII